MNIRFVFLVSLLALGLSFGFAQTGNTSAAPPTALQNYWSGRNLEARDRTGAERYYNEAVRICLDEIARNAGTSDTYAALTMTLRRQEKFTEAVQQGERGLRIFPNDYRIVETLGESWFHLYNYENSLRYMQRYVNAVPQGDRTSVAYFYIGETYRLQQKYLRADIAYTTAVTLEPSSALWWFRLGQVREAARDLTPAREAYERALRLEPGHREASAGLQRVRQPL
ncbi:hypothetical protein AGMMS49928_10680 [Spirochaetia bacterium]|nr:hypothetical protein AGMMS49928_10680 [Spirochaetia bacterium]